jgi:hypothetical protein
LEGSIADRPNSVLAGRYPGPYTLTAMNSVAYHGEVWTDGSGFATVLLPAAARQLEPPLEYELRDLEPPSSARVTADLDRGRFTIATDQPHVKVAWRITGQSRQRPQEEE